MYLRVLDLCISRILSYVSTTVQYAATIYPWMSRLDVSVSLYLDFVMVYGKERLTSITNGLFVNYDIGSIGPWSRDSRCDSSCVCLQDDSIISVCSSRSRIRWTANVKQSRLSKKDDRIWNGNRWRGGSRTGKRRRPTHHQQSHQQPKAPNPILPKHSSSQPDPSTIMIQHHGKPLKFEITWPRSMSRVDRR